MICSTEESNMTCTGRSMEVLSADQYVTPADSDSHADLNDSSLVSFRKRAALRCRIGTLYVSRRSVKNRISQTMATSALIQSIIRQPSDSAMTPLIPGPRAPPTSGASMTRDIPDPRVSGLKRSPMIEGLSTFDATANPFKKRAKIKRCTVSLKAASTTPTMKMMLAMLKAGYRPYISDIGAISSGPHASPSSQTVTSRMLADSLSFPSKSCTIRCATGTIPIHVNDLDLGSVNPWKIDMCHGNSSYTVKDIRASKETTPILYAFGQSRGLSGSPLGSKSTGGRSTVRDCGSLV